MLEEKRLYFCQMVIGAILFLFLLIANNINEEWMSCLNPEVAGEVIKVLNFYYRNKVFIASILNPISITFFLTGFVASQNLKLKRTRSNDNQIELLFRCKYYLMSIYTPEELSEFIKVKDLTDSRLIKSIIQKGKLEQLIESINDAYYTTNWEYIEFDFDSINTNRIILNKLNEIRNWAKQCVDDCELMINGKIVVFRIDIICPKPWLEDINECIKLFIDNYYKGDSKEKHLFLLENQWKEREAKIKQSAVTAEIGKFFITK